MLEWRLDEWLHNRVRFWLAPLLLLLVLLVQLQWNLLRPVLLGRPPCCNIVERLKLVVCRSCPLLVTLAMYPVLWRTVLWRRMFALYAGVVGAGVSWVLDVKIVLALLLCIPALIDGL